MENNTPDTNNFLNWVEIKNFKSIKDLRLDCKRVNVFIGKPNVGKSNILEGLGLLGIEYSGQLFLKNLIRYKEIRHLFYENNNELIIQVRTDKNLAFLRKDRNSVSDYEYFSKGGIEKQTYKDYVSRILDTSYRLPSKFDFVVSKEGDFDKSLANRGFDFEKITSVKKYDFVGVEAIDEAFMEFLLPPHGNNLFNIIDRRDNLKEEFGKLFKEQGLDFVLDRERQLFELQRRSGYYVHKFDFYTIADTFRRYMFYITAIESNKNSVIVFEEPEVHSFPPYVKTMAHRIAASEQNQFFISTHSPYLLQTLIDELDESELAVYITYYKDYQTHVRQLTADELQEARDLSIDLFYNLSRYEPNA